MKKTFLSAALLAVCGLAVTPAFASDGTITINGQVTAATCTISVNGGSNNGTVTLPTVQAAALNGAAGTTAAFTSFTIALSGCAANGATQTKVAPYFEPGPNVDTATGYLKPTGAGTATGVETVLSTTSSLSGKVNLNANATAQFTGTAPTYTSNPTFTYYAGYVSTAASVTAGTTNTSVTYSLAYQ